MIIATWITRQLVFDGAVVGMVYGLVAMGVLLVHRATRVVNFAVGNMGLVGTGLFALLEVQWGVPFWIAAAIALVVGVAFGALVELLVVRRLFREPRVVLLVATIGIAQLALLIQFSYPEFDNQGARFPQAIGTTWDDVAGVRVSGARAVIAIVVPVLAAVLGWFLTRTTLGKTIRASAENPNLARLSGINPKLVSTFVWAIAGGLSTISIALLTADAGRVSAIGSFGSSTLVRALAAAVIARMASFPRAFIAGIVIGVAESLVRFNYLDQAGLIDFLLLVAVLIAVFLESRGHGTIETQSFALSSRSMPVPERLQSIWWVRQLDRVPFFLIGIAAVALPFVVTESSRHQLYARILAFAVCACSLTVLTGWAGQISLGQMAFAGIGAFTAAGFHRGFTWDIRLGDTRINKAGLEGLPMELSIVLAALVTAVLAAVIGAGALRVRGLLLAVSTFAFALACSQYVYRRPLLTANIESRVPFERSDLFGIPVTSQRAWYFVCLVVLGVAFVVIGRLRRSAAGWSTVAVRDNADTAAAYTISPTLVKVRTFALAGGLAGLGGALLAGVTQGIPLPVDRFFEVDDSLNLVAVAVIGGLGSTIGPLLGSIWVFGLPSIFPDSDVAPLLTSSVGLLILLLYVPGGFAQVGHMTRDALLSWMVARRGEAPTKHHQSVPASLARPGRVPPPTLEGSVLRATDITVRFGGNVAVDGASIELGAGEVVGLIGTNGAGKSTLMNAVGGYVRSTGTVHLLGAEVSSLSPARRASRGLGRTFQSATLFPDLTVRETVQVALEARGHSGMVSAALPWPPAMARHRRHRAAADDIIDFLGLGRYADSHVANLSTGTRRIVELANLLAVDARVLCLDEPTAGVAQRETEAFGPLILELRRELDASMLVIEHDMPLIMGISDRVYCLEAGRVIAVGDPASVRNDPAVIASYLGTDERAIARSGSVPTG